MTVTYGVQPDGFVKKPLQAILADLAAAQRATISARINTSTTSVFGQNNGIYARELSILWEQAEVLYHSNDPDAAEDMLLTMLCKLTGTIRRPATPSTVVLECELDVGTTLLAGTHFASMSDRPGVRWTPKEDFTATSTANFSRLFVSEQLGPVDAAVFAINTIATPVIGFKSVSNLVEPTPGIVADTDPTLRLNRELELAAVGSTTVRAISAKILEAFPGDVKNLTIFENDTDYVDGTTGNAPHSLEVLIWDGASPSVDDDALAQVIWDCKAGGVQTVGSHSGTAIIDDAGTTKTVYFTRATAVPIYLSYTITTGTGYIGNATLKTALKNLLNASVTPNQDVIAIVAEAAALPSGVGAGVTDITAFTLGIAPSPVGTTNIVIGLREIAQFDPTQITITP